MESFSNLASIFWETLLILVQNLHLVLWLGILTRVYILTLSIIFLNFNGVTLMPLGLRSSYASQHSQLGQDLRSAVSPELHITPIYEGRTFYSPVYRSPNHGTVELQGSQTALYRTGSGGHQLCSAAFPISLAQQRILLRFHFLLEGNHVAYLVVR